MTTQDRDGGSAWRGRFARWRRRMWNGEPEAPPFERRTFRTFVVLLGATAVLLVVGVVSGSDQLFLATMWSYSLAGGVFLVYLVFAARRARRTWAEAWQPAFDLASIGSEPGVIVKRRPLASRAGFIGLGAGCVGGALNIALDGSTPLFVRFTGACLFVALGAFAASFAGSTLVVTHSLIAARTNLRWRTASWEEVRAIEPSHEGLVFELKDGRRFVAAVTAKNGLTFLRPRHDKALLEALRARLR